MERAVRHEAAVRLSREDEFLLAEYGRLKDEQLARISTRDRLIYVNLAVSGVVVSTALREGPGVGRLAVAVLPWTCLLFGWLYWVNDSKVGQIRDYVRDVLRPRAGEGVAAFGWETYHGGRRWPVVVWVSRAVVSGATFVGPGLLAAAAAPAMTGHHAAVTAACAAAGVLLVMLFALQTGVFNGTRAKAVSGETRLRVRR